MEASNQMPELKVANPTTVELIEYVKDIRENLDRGIEINILGLPHESRMFKGIQEILYTARKMEQTEEREKAQANKE